LFIWTGGQVSLHVVNVTWTDLDSLAFRIEWQQPLPEFDHFLFLSYIKFWFVTIVPKYLNCATVSNNLCPVFSPYFVLHFGDETAINTLFSLGLFLA
jgi:hypothetical protein